MTIRDEEGKVELTLVGANGQISLGEEYAGQPILIEKSEPGVWRIRVVNIIPANELWLHMPETQAKLQEAFAWLTQNPGRETTPEELEGLRDA